MEAYRMIRKYSPNCLIFISESYWWNNIESDNRWPRLAPDVTGVVMDMHRYTKRPNLNMKGMEMCEVKAKVANHHLEGARAISAHYITVTGEFSMGIS
jgi:hypothetical protein